MVEAPDRIRVSWRGELGTFPAIANFNLSEPRIRRVVMVVQRLLRRRAPMHPGRTFRVCWKAPYLWITMCLNEQGTMPEHSYGTFACRECVRAYGYDCVHPDSDCKIGTVSRILAL